MKRPYPDLTAGYSLHTPKFRYGKSGLAILGMPQEQGMGERSTTGHANRVKVFHQFRIAFESQVHGWREIEWPNLDPYPTDWWPGDPQTPANLDPQLKGRKPVMRSCFHIHGLVPTMRYRLYWNIGEATHHATFQALKREHWLFAPETHDYESYTDEAEPDPDRREEPDDPGSLVNGNKVSIPGSGGRTWDHPEATDPITLGDDNHTAFEPETYHGPNGSYTDAIPGSTLVQ